MERPPTEQRILDTFIKHDRLAIMPTKRSKRLVVLFVDEGFLTRADNLYWRSGGTVDV